MTAEELQAIAADAAQQTATYQHMTETVKFTGQVFDYKAPLPPMPDYRAREWEPRIEYFGRLQVVQPTKPRKAA